MYGIRTDPKTPPEVRAAVTPRMQADRPVGEWNRFEITVQGKTVTHGPQRQARHPGAAIPTSRRGPLALQHHGGKRGDRWTGPPSLVQYKNIFIKELE